MAAGKWLKISVCLLAVFVAGGITGSMLALHFGRHALHARIDVPKMSEHIMTHLETELQLTADEKEKIRPIIVESLQKQQAIHDQSHSQIEAARQDGQSKIMPLLSADQQAKFQEMEQRWKNRVHGGDHGSP